MQEAISPRESVRGAFTGGVQQQADQIANGDYGPVEGQTGGWGQGASSQAQQQPNGGGTGWGQQAQQPPFDGGQPAAAAEPEKPKRNRSRKAAEPEAAGSGVQLDADLVAIGVREKVLLAVMSASPEASVEDLVDITHDLVGYILTGEKPQA